jgi:hypothetical protein
MVTSGYTTPTGRIVVKGEAPQKTYHNLGDATNAYPGRLVIKEATSYDVEVSDALHPVAGVLGYEDANPIARPATISTIYAVDKEVPVLRGKGFTVYAPAGIPVGFVAEKDDLLASWVGGQYVPCALFGGRIGLKIPFTKKATDFDTGIDLPAGLNILGYRVDVRVAVAEAVIDIGLLNTESGGDLDGFADGASLAATGIVSPVISDTTDTDITLGTLLCDVSKSADTTANYIAAPVNYVTDGTAKSITYKTTDATVSGYFYLLVESPGVQVVGRAGEAANASAAAAGVFVEFDV